MTKINDPANLNGKLFRYEIKYNNLENSSNAPARFNGNIAEIDWMTGTVPNGTKRRYSYQYDGLNRLLRGVYSQPGSSVSANDYFSEILSYDINGNITTLKRFSAPSSGTFAEKKDDLVYNYTGNRVIKITDGSGNASGYPGGGNSIEYDANGNIKNMMDKKIKEIGYNFLNLPRTILITPTTGKQINVTYNYRADGTKLSKKFTQNTNIVTTDYLDGFQYEHSVLLPTAPDLKFAPTAEGYYNFENNKYIYNYADHLGNVRVSYFNNGSGIEVIGENNYYPFGLRHEGYNDFDGNTSYQYKYQGQELQTETGWYSFKWRNYMPDIGRFFNVDPLAEKYNTWTPYAFSGNRVIDARELEGLEPHVLFNTRENAAANFGQQYNGRSILQKREYAAIIYVKVVEGKKYYAYNRPARGGAHGLTTDQLNKYIPKGTVPTAIAHTHGNDDYGPGNNYDDQNFSDNDKSYAGDLKLDAFLVTPEGSLKYYDLSSGTEKTVRTDMPSDPDNETPRVNNINPILNPNPSLGDYRPKPKPFPNFEPISNDKPKPTLDNGLKSIEDMNTRKQQSPLINRTGLEYIQ